MDYMLKRIAAFTPPTAGSARATTLPSARCAASTRESLCIPSSSICKYWKRSGVGDATRATFLSHRRFDLGRGQVIGTDLIRRPTNDLFIGNDARFDKAAYRVVCDA